MVMTGLMTVVANRREEMFEPDRFRSTVLLRDVPVLEPLRRSTENGGTFIVPGSHRSSNNPSGKNGVDPLAPYASEMQACGEAGNVLVFDSRLWHATAPNRSDRPRVGLAVRFAPWWLHLDILMPGSDERKRMVEETGRRENWVEAISSELYESLPGQVRPLFRHWVRPRH